ncbi:dehydrogenase/reductase SDR family member 11-like [Oreochromis aureus]|uniref:dehydrogenase/reductase SDR family member 11-like n=1 Tax=Oreochromis aureus TaxID=47969 RepID=UPI00195421F6|nr:dehydrogenase/reductase SDR family member 11-like [Oreochromis aureus]CAI5693196.1 unnamed protein product [Mustela putorius furo]
MKTQTFCESAKYILHKIFQLYQAYKLAAECQSAVYPGVLVPFKCDLTKEEEILAMFAAIKKQHKGVDVCINNPGLGQHLCGVVRNFTVSQ